MAVLRENKQKFHPVMDNYELNEHINAYTAGADICAHRLREWQRQGVGPLLWCWTVAGPTYKYTLKGHCGCFRPWRPDTALLDWCLVSTWLLTSWGGLSARWEHPKGNIILHWWRLRQWKYYVFPGGQKTFWAFQVDTQGARASPGWGEGARIPCQQHGESLHWRRSSEVLPIITRQSTFSVCGKLVGHFPVCGWLRVAVAAIKRCATPMSPGWDNEVCDATLRSMLT